ncbi:hypothetical protein ACFO3K_10460 [Cellulomonas algicola]|uniref:hypothetical protein n=1 Tax=Cellulomonas algicola TaxID=2071633 RepID=UPI001C3F6F93|nr:hypothetical protein [Cellulomonas algicola]
MTGAPCEADEYAALDPEGRALLRAVPYVPPHALPSEDLPLQLVPGRTIYHVHTRTTTPGRARAPELALLPDLRTVDVLAHGLAHGVASDWELIGQAAQGVRARDLVDLSQRCRSETIRQARWADAMLKESATQILVS